MQPGRDLGVAQVAGMQQTWERMKPYVDADRFGQVAAFLAIQHREAQWWRDASISYFQSLSKQPLPAGPPGSKRYTPPRPTRPRPPAPS